MDPQDLQADLASLQGQRLPRGLALTQCSAALPDAAAVEGCAGPAAALLAAHRLRTPGCSSVHPL